MTNEQNPSLENDPGQIQESVERIRRFCRDILAHVRLQLRVEVSGESRGIVVNLTGPDRPMLLSNAASLLNSLEYLVNRSFHTGKDEKIATILFDTDNYRQHREAELTLLAKMASDKVIAQRRPLVLQPMTPRERRIVHLALAGIEGIRSESSGSGDQRSVTIYPTE